MNPYVRELITQVPNIAGAFMVCTHLTHDGAGWGVLGLLLIAVGSYVRGATYRGSIYDR